MAAWWGLIRAGTLETELTHIHSGQCGDTLGGVVFPLISFVGDLSVVVEAIPTTLSRRSSATQGHLSGLWFSGVNYNNSLSRIRLQLAA